MKTLWAVGLTATIGGCGSNASEALDDVVLTSGAPIDAPEIERLELELEARIDRSESALDRMAARQDALVLLDRAVRSDDGTPRPGGMRLLLAMRDRLLDAPAAIDDARAVELEAVLSGGSFQPTEDDLALRAELAASALAVPYEPEGQPLVPVDPDGELITETTHAEHD